MSTRISYKCTRCSSERSYNTGSDEFTYRLGGEVVCKQCFNPNRSHKVKGFPAITSHEHTGAKSSVQKPFKG